jgi:vitamin B12 transporter
MRSTLVVAGIAGVIFCNSVIAASPSSSPSIVVTATRTARTVDDSLAAVSVITREDIERRQPQDLVDLLRTQAGVDLTRAGGPGGNISLFLRGTNSNHVLVLVDGVRVASATTGTFDWRSFPVGQIERIEIVRGPRASLYGSDAIGGVIQIFTRRPQDLELALGAGSHRTRDAEAAWGSTGPTRGFVTATHRETEGFSAQNERGFSFDPDNDGLRQQSVSAGMETKLGEKARIELRGWQSRGSAQFDVGDSRLLNESVNTRLLHATSSTWSQTFSLSAANDTLETSSFSTSRFATKRQMADWQNDFTLGQDSLLSAGLSYMHDQGENLSGTTTVFDNKQYDRAAFALWQSKWGEYDLQIAGRHDDYSSFGGHNTGSAALGREFSSRTRGWISYGTAFRAPSLNDLFSPGFGGLFAGNPNLNPERSRSLELGVRHRFSTDQTLKASLYDTHIEDLIAFEGPGFQAINVAEATVRGLEVEHGIASGAWRLTNAVTLQRTRNERTDTSLLQRPDAKLSTLLERDFSKRAAAGAELILSSSRRDVSGGEIAGYGVVNLAARYALRRDLTLEGRLENLFDKKYQLIDGFNTPDRSLFVTLRYRP